MIGAIFVRFALSIALVNSLESENLIGLFNGRTRTADFTCTNIYGPKCGDCNTLLTCVGGKDPILTQKCPVEYPGQPYCVDDTCTSEINANDDSCSAGIECTAAGYFPNPTNCSQYYLCAGPSQSSFVYECLNGYVYNSVDKSCKRKNSNADCSTINCAANPNRYVVYPGDRAYYAFCLNNGGISNPIMFRCADPENSEFIQATRKCVFQCKTEGRVADPKNCQLYYECYRIGSTYISRSQKCITGFIFDDTKKRCVAGTCPSSTTSPASPTSSTSAS